MSTQSGFTLTELLVAVLVFGMISAISTALLTTALTSREVHADTLAVLASVQRARTLLRDDMGQLVLRPYRTAEGLTGQIVFAGDDEGADPYHVVAINELREVLTLTRRGWANPGGAQPRSTLQRVAWVYDGTVLSRRAWNYPDTARDGEPAELVVLDHVEELQLEFLVGTVWLPQAMIGAGSDEPGAAPRALRIRYVVPGLGQIEHVVLGPAPELGS